MISITVARAENHVIGCQGQLPWHLPADLRRFKSLTVGHPIIMGRRTYESISRPLPKRTSIVMTHHLSSIEPHRNLKVVQSFQEALSSAQQLDEQIFIIGGSNVYAQALGIADRVYLTVIHAVFHGDTFFPQLDEKQWVLKEDRRLSADSKNPYAYSFRCYDRRRSAPVS